VPYAERDSKQAAKFLVLRLSNMLFTQAFCAVQKNTKTNSGRASPRTTLDHWTRSSWGRGLAAPNPSTPPPSRPFGPRASTLRFSLLRSPNLEHRSTPLQLRPYCSRLLYVIDCAPSLGVIIFLSLTLSVCLFVCHAAPSNRFFLVSRWNRAIF